MGPEGSETADVYIGIVLLIVSLVLLSGCLIGIVSHFLCPYVLFSSEASLLFTLSVRLVKIPCINEHQVYNLICPSVRRLCIKENICINILERFRDF